MYSKIYMPFLSWQNCTYTFLLCYSTVSYRSAPINLTRTYLTAAAARKVQLQIPIFDIKKFSKKPQKLLDPKTGTRFFILRSIEI
jgi:hypothetical protein